MFARSAVRTLFVFITSIFVGASVSAAALARDAERIDAPTRGESAVLTEPLRLGRAVLDPDEEAAVYVLLAGERPCGILIDGPARFTYTVVDEFSIPVARRNIGRASSLDPRTSKDGLHVTDRLKGAVIWGWTVAEAAGADATQGGGGGPETAEATEDGALPRWAAKILEDPMFSHPSNELLEAESLTDPGAVYGLLRGHEEDMLLSIDPAVSRLETLYRVDHVTTRDPVDGGRPTLEELAAQPIGRDWWDRPATPLVAVEEKLEVDNDEGEHGVFSSVTTLQAKSTVGVWRAGLIERRIDKATERPLTVTEVTVDGKPADFLHQDSELLVDLGETLRAGQRVDVSVRSEGDILIHPGGDNYWWLGTWPWYPQPPLNAELARIEITVRTPEDLRPFASGATIEERTADGRNLLRTRLDQPMQIPTVAAGKYHVHSKTKNGITCNVAAYAFGKERACRKLANNFFEAAKFYRNLLGLPYPFEDFDVVEVNRWGFGQAPPGMIFITKEAYNPLGETVSQIFSAGVNQRFVHEIAHAWWGHIAKMDSGEEQWFTEALAQYSSALCMQAMEGGRSRRGRKEFKKYLDEWEAGLSRLGDGTSVYLCNHLAGHDSKDYAARTRILYNKGPLVLHALRNELADMYGGRQGGDRYFFTLLRAYLKNFQFRHAPTRHMVGIRSQITGEDWQPWFERYVYGSEMPPLE